MRLLKDLSRRRGCQSDRGAIALIVAVLALVLFVLAAFAVDITTQVSRKFDLANQVDATVINAASNLSTGGSLKAAAEAARDTWNQAHARNGEGSDEDADWDWSYLSFWCVVKEGDPAHDAVASSAVANTAVPAVCNPDAVSGETGTFRKAAYQDRVRASDGAVFDMSCNGTVCAIPCGLKATTPDWDTSTSQWPAPAGTRPVTCNAVMVSSERGVHFAFGGATGTDSGGVDATSMACRGPCGKGVYSPMNVVLMADRVIDIGLEYNQAMVAGYRGLLQQMDPSQQYVAVGYVARTATTARVTPLANGTCSGNSCPFKTVAGSSAYSNGATTDTCYPSTGANSTTTGKWVPMKLATNYKNAAGTALQNDVKNALDCIDRGNSSPDFTCLSQAYPDPTFSFCSQAPDSPSQYAARGRSLAAAAKEAARLLLNKEDNGVSSLPARQGNVSNVLVLEAEGAPLEYPATTTGATGLDSATEPFANFQETTQLGAAVAGVPSGITPPAPAETAGTKYFCGSKTSGADGGPTNAAQITSPADFGTTYAGSGTPPSTWCKWKPTNTVSGTGSNNAWRSASTQTCSWFGCTTTTTYYCNSASTGPSAPGSDGGPTSGAQLTTASHFNTSTTAKPAATWCQWKATAYTTTSSAGRSYQYVQKYLSGGQQACQNLIDVAKNAKSAGVTVATILYGDTTSLNGYDVDCRKWNAAGPLGSSGYYGTSSYPWDYDTLPGPYISDIQPSTCRSGGSGTVSSPYTLKTDCSSFATATYTVPVAAPDSSCPVVDAAGSRSCQMSDVLAAASGTSQSTSDVTNHCLAGDDRTTENSDHDYFFCAASSTELDTLFPALSQQLDTTVKLMRMP